MLLAVTFYIRYKQVLEYCSSYQVQTRFTAINSLSLLAGWSGALGLSVIANFQVNNLIFVVIMKIFVIGDRG